MANGDGSIRERKNPKTGKSYNPKRWEVTISLGVDPVTGKYRKVKRTVSGTKTEAAKVRDSLKSKRDSGIGFDAERITFKEYADGWHQRRADSGEYKRRTIIDERNKLNKLEIVLGTYPLAKVDALTAERAIDQIRNSGMGKRGGKLSGTTTRAYFNLASQVFKDAWRKRLIAENPFERLTPPKRDTKPRELIPLPELRRIMNAAQSSYHAKFEEFEAKELRMERLPKSSQRSSVLGLMQLSCPLVVLVAFSTGIRISEALGLTWGCVKPNTCDSILIRQSLDCDGKTLTAPKTKAGNRKLDVPETIAPYLVEWHGIQCRALKSLGIEVSRDTPVFCSNVGGFIDQGNYGTWRKSFIKEKGLRPFGMHDLRHAWASHLLANGLDLKRAQKLIGHSSPDCLARTYAHAVDDGRERAALIIDGVLEEMAV